MPSSQHTPPSAVGELPRQLDRYMLEAPLGAGGFGNVFRARHVHTRREVALKLLHADRLGNADELARFKQEARALTMVESPYIVEVLDWGVVPSGEAFLVMELLEGDDLASVLRREQSLPMERALRLGLQIADALAAIHRAGVIHRDLKPSNVFLTAEDGVRLIDFGISRVDRPPESVRIYTRTGAVLGTPGYMAPELLRAQLDADVVTDLYALSVLLYQMLAGRRPHAALAFEDLVLAVCTTRAPPLSRWRPDVPPGVEAIIMRGLERERDARWQDAESFRAALAAAAGLDPPVSAPSIVSGPWLGQRIGGCFRLEEIVSVTGLTALYRARVEDGGQAAVKMRLGRGRHDPAEEVERLRALEIPRLVRYLGGGYAKGLSYLAVEWLEGESLRERLAQRRFTRDESIALVADVCRTLASLHESNLSYCKLTTSKIFFDASDELRLLDLGLDSGSHGSADDIHGAGCILFECVTGRAPESPRDVHGLPRELEELVRSMLGPPEQRPSARDVAARLDGIRLGETGPRSIEPAVELFSDELRRVCVTLVSMRGASEESLRRRASAFGGHLHPLTSSQALVLFEQRLPIVEEAARAVRCALAMASAAPVTIGVATTRSLAQRPEGQALDRARRLAAHERHGVIVDDVTAHLLDPRFEREHCQEDWQVLRFALAFESVRVDAPMIGRRREWNFLRGILEDSREDRRASATVLLGPPGIGKSRLAREVITALTPLPAVLFASGDPSAAGAPFGILSRALRRAVGVDEAHAPHAQHRALLAHLASIGMESEQASSVASFFAAMMGLWLDDESEQVRRARGDAVLMGAQIRRAFCDWMAAETRRAGLLVFVVEDLQWADAPSIGLLAAALRELEEAAFAVIAIARSDADRSLLDPLFAKEAHTLRLGPLRRRDAVAMVRAAMPDMDEERAAHLAEHAGGSPFFLEELVQAARRGDGVSASVLAIVEDSLQELSEGERRLLRVASVFGDTIHWSGLIAVFGEDHAAEIESALRKLTASNMLARRYDADLGGDPAYAFRNELTRRAAYDMLAPADRAFAHHIAAKWLEWRGIGSPLLLAAHWRNAGQPLRAAPWYLKAAQQALAGNDFESARRWCDAGLACEPTGELHGELQLAAAAVHEWSGESASRAAAAESALACFAPASSSWFAAIDHALTAYARLGELQAVPPLLERLLSLPGTLSSSDAEIDALARVAGQLMIAGANDEGRGLLTRAERRAETLPAIGARTRGWLAWARAWAALSNGDLGGSQRCDAESVRAFTEAADLCNACYARANVGYDHMRLGDYASAESELRAALVTSERLGLELITGASAHNLGLLLALRGAVAEGRQIEERAIALLGKPMSLRLHACAHEYLARILLLQGAADAAEVQARRAIEHARAWPAILALAHTTHARALLALGNNAEALAAARAARALIDPEHHPDGEGPYVQCTLAEALLAACDPIEAREVAGAAFRALMGVANRIVEPELRASMLERVPEHARLVELAARLRVQT